jgi:hypothetical protein
MRFALCLATVAWIGCKSPENTDSKTSSNGIEIVNQGAEPRKRVHYSLAKDARSRVELALDMNLTAGAMGGAIPTVAITIEIAVEGVMPTGHANVRMTVVDAVARERPDSQVPTASMTPQLETIKGISILATLAPDGKLSNAHVDLSGAKNLSQAQAAQVDSLVTSFQQVTMPLPDVPLGVGATWKSPRPIEQGGMKMTAINTVTLTKIEGSTLTYTSTAELQGADQTVTISGVAIRVEHIAGQTDGHGTIDLAKLTITGEINATFKAEMSAQNEKTPMQISTKLTLTPR